MTTAVQNNSVSSNLLAAVNGTSSASSTSDAEATQDRFLKLLVTQMQNQDPLSPMDNSQMTSQLAQLSTVSGIDKLNTTLQALSGSYQSSQSLEAANLIGKGVLTAGSSMNLQKGSAVFGVDLSAPADDVKIAITDANGRTVRTMDLGAQDAGAMAFQWDGNSDSGAASADGSYKFSVSATKAGQAVSADALVYGQVDSVSRNAQGVKLNVQDVGQVDLDKVLQIL